MAKGKKPKGSGQKLQKEISPSEESQEENIETQNGFLLIADIADFENDIIAVRLDEEMKNALRCEIGTDLFIDKPWKTIPKSVLCEQASKKAFQPYEKVIEDYPFSEILVGYEPFGYGKADEYLVCITERGRNRVLEQLKLLRESYIQSAEKANSLKPRPWESLGSEKEIGIDKDVYNRPLISFEWIGNIISRTRKKPKFEPTFAHKAKYGYNCVKDTRHTYDLVEKFTSDVSCQAGPTISTVESQTVTEIPIHASTQYKPEEEIPVNRGISSKAEGSALEKHVKLYADRIIKAIEYNQEYDLYKDDYKDLALAGKEFDLSPNHIYKHYLTFNDILQIEGKVITDTAWHPNLTGVVAASYGVDVPSKIEHLDSNSDDTEYEPEDTDPEPEEEPEVEPHDQKLRKAWLDGARQYEKNVTQVNMDHWHRAMRTLNVIENAKIELAIKEEETVEEEDTESENAFEYVMFEDLASRLLKKKMAVAKKKLKKKLKHVRKKLRARRKKKALERASKEVEDLSGEMPPEGTEEIIPKILPETSEKILEKLSPKISKEKNKKKKKKHRKKKKSDGKNKKSHKKHHRRKCKKKKAMKKSQKSKNAASKKERIPRWAKMFVNNPASSYGNEFGRNKQNDVLFLSNRAKLVCIS
ncbi:hypothetical protein AAG570_000593 [Ranatra chinensis]|uniref:Uncharacterized protein n=1 Tax=Ranatra chinensis TaxID=642074 RepID=A0ABD0ZIP6_9HEMI